MPLRQGPGFSYNNLSNRGFFLNSGVFDPSGISPPPPPVRAPAAGIRSRRLFPPATGTPDLHGVAVCRRGCGRICPYGSCRTPPAHLCLLFRPARMADGPHAGGDGPPVAVRYRYAGRPAGCHLAARVHVRAYVVGISATALCRCRPPPCRARSLIPRARKSAVEPLHHVVVQVAVRTYVAVVARVLLQRVPRFGLCSTRRGTSRPCRIPARRGSGLRASLRSRTSGGRRPYPCVPPPGPPPSGTRSRRR